MSFQIPLISLVTVMIGSNLVNADDHGCLSSAGYSWCAPLEQCVRPWITHCCAEGQEWCVATKSCFFPIGGYCESRCSDGQKWCVSGGGYCYYPIGGYCENTVHAASDIIGGIDEADDFYKVTTTTTTTERASSCKSLWNKCSNKDECCSKVCTCDSSGDGKDCGCTPFQTVADIETTDLWDMETSSIESGDDENEDPETTELPLPRLLGLNLKTVHPASDQLSVVSINALVQTGAVRVRLVAVLNGHGFMVYLDCDFTVISVQVDNAENNLYFMYVAIDCNGIRRTAKVRYTRTVRTIINFQFIAWTN